MTEKPQTVTLRFSNPIDVRIPDEQWEAVPPGEEARLLSRIEEQVVRNAILGGTMQLRRSSDNRFYWYPYEDRPGAILSVDWEADAHGYEYDVL